MSGIQPPGQTRVPVTGTDVLRSNIAFDGDNVLLYDGISIANADYVLGPNSLEIIDPVTSLMVYAGDDRKRA